MNEKLDELEKDASKFEVKIKNAKSDHEVQT